VFQGNSTELGFTDSNIEFGTDYEYLVQSVQKVDDNKFAESDLSEIVAFNPVDKFAPATPAGLSAASGTRTIELVWDRNTEKDMAFYRIYRDGSRLADNVVGASFSDDGAEAGKTYKYQVSAVDTAGNESALSAPIEAGIR
jgi:fibronectin type 3 domain-containing protein